MRILLTNDDGIHAPGLRAMREALAQLGEVTTIAPATEQSGVGLSITYLHPLMVQREMREGELYGYAVHGSPADCVKLGVLQLCDERPDLIVSGINSGSNAGINVLYSGTVAGAIEGAFFGVTSVAVSQAVDEPPDYPAAAARAVELIGRLLDRQPPTGSLWNLNLPTTRPGWPRGLKLVPLGVRRHSEVMERRIDPRGRPYYWSGINHLQQHEMDPETDLHELADGYATLTPLHFDITATDLLSNRDYGDLDSGDRGTANEV